MGVIRVEITCERELRNFCCHRPLGGLLESSKTLRSSGGGNYTSQSLFTYLAIRSISKYRS